MGQYYFNLKGQEEWLFRQSSFGGVNHIVVDATEYLQVITAGPPFPELRIDTWCGKNLKYGAYSSMIKRDAGIRNCCEYCAVEYEPEDKVERRHKESARNKIGGDLPF